MAVLCPAHICTLLDDIHHTVMKYRIPITESALHVYHSALVTMPHCSLRNENSWYEEEIPELISSRSENWGSRVQILEGHDGEVTSVAYSPNGKYIASGSDDGTVRVWDATTATLRHTLTGHDSRVTSVSFSPDGKYIASGSYDWTVRVWDATTATLRHTLTGHDSLVTSVSFSPDGKYIASGSNDGTVRVWDATTATLRHTLTGHDAGVGSVSFSPDGKHIVSRSHDGTTIIWDAHSGNRCNDHDGESLRSASPNPEQSPSSTDHIPAQDPLEAAEYRNDAGWTLFKLDSQSGWISRRKRGDTWCRVCWLPVELRFNGRLAHCGEKVVVGATSGAVTILDFSRVD
jgi:WD40 repeat protein